MSFFSSFDEEQGHAHWVFDPASTREDILDFRVQELMCQLLAGRGQLVVFHIGPRC